MVDQFTMKNLRDFYWMKMSLLTSMLLSCSRPRQYNNQLLQNHLFIKNLGASEGNIYCIPTNDEQYISFTKQIVIGSYTDKKRDEKNIMASSFNKLSSNLDKSCFTNTSKFYDRNQFDLLLRKGVYPYEYMDSHKRLDETSGEGINEDDYKHAQRVWKEFGMKTLRDYHDMYNRSDVLLLADVFENFRDVCSKNYGLDPAWYYTALGQAWDTALKITGVNLELIYGIDMLFMIKKGIRDGVSMIRN
ncbi:hypothetical protein CAPTEDRAFT_208655, partial [Capitella teleta]